MHGRGSASRSSFRGAKSLGPRMTCSATALSGPLGIGVGGANADYAQSVVFFRTHPVSRPVVLVEGRSLIVRKKFIVFLGLAAYLLAAPWAVAQDKPNILVIWGDDVGQSNISAYTRGLVGYKTPNIDRIANEGMLFTDYYGEQSCTAGRSSFIMGQSVFRTGLSKVGLPGAKEGMMEEDPTIAGLLKAEGYATGQFGKNHLGDRDEHLPTNHGFDEFYGNLYHLNAEEEPENEDYPKNPDFKKRLGPRGVLDCKATDKDDPTVDPRFGKMGKQECKDTGALTRKRMETADEEFLDRTTQLIRKNTEAG